jgi:hypothetical protein
MEIDFWYTNIIPSDNIKSNIQQLDENIIFKNVDMDIIDETKLNFFVFLWETSFAFPNTSHTHTDEFINLLIKLQNKNFYFISDFSGEAHTYPDGLSLSFLDRLKSNGININRLIVTNNDSTKIGLHKIRYESHIINVCFFPNFFLSTYNRLNEYIIDFNSSLVPDKNFLCLNRRMFYHKYKIIEELFNRGLLDETRFTWVENKISEKKLNKNLISELNIDVNDFKSIQLENDVMYGSELAHRDEYLYRINPKWYYKSKVNIITETMLDEKEIHITEKTWKAIHLGVPFVISASKYHLRTLREMGFKTFNSVVNEDYDEMIGDNKIKQIIDSALELSNIYNTPEVVDICKFNQKLYFNKSHRKKILNEYFLNHLHNIQKQLEPINLI